MYEGYFRIKRSTAFTTAEKDALKALWIQSDSQPNNITHVRKSLDSKEVICECCADPTPIEDDIPFNVDEFVIFDGEDKTESAPAARDYLSANDELWNKE